MVCLMGPPRDFSHIVYATTLGFWLPWSILKGPKEDGEDDRIESPNYLHLSSPQLVGGTSGTSL